MNKEEIMKLTNTLIEYLLCCDDEEFVALIISSIDIGLMFDEETITNWSE